MSGLVAPGSGGAPRVADVKCGGRPESGKYREQGFGMGVTHWHPGWNCGMDSSADRKAVRIA